ncbi:MAG: NACHT domain-containing protein, partial [Roseimicrobium sp.]
MPDTEHTLEVVPIPPPEAPDEAAFYNPFDVTPLIAYQRDLVDWHGYIKFLGLNSMKETTEDTEIETLFVVPHLAESHIRPQELAGKQAKTRGIKPVLEALRQNRRLVVLGDPGSGKSTLVNWLAASLLRGGGAGPGLRSVLGSVVPLPIVLRELDLSKLTGDFHSLLDAFLKRPVAKALERSFVLDLLARGQALVLVDGIDELGGATTRERIREAVWDGWRRFPQARWLLTSRIIGYEECSFDEQPLTEGEQLKARQWLRAHNVVAEDLETGEMENFDPEPSIPISITLASVFYTAPFNDDEVRQFALCWFRRYEQNPGLREDAAMRFLSAIRAHPHVDQLSRNPILLTFMALVYRSGVRLPEGRAKVYAKISETYLETLHLARDMHKMPEWRTPFTLVEKEAILAHVAFRAQAMRTSDHSEPDEDASREVLMHHQDLRGWMREALSRLQVPEADLEETVTQALRFMGQRTGLLVPRGEGRYAFMHLSFQEFYASRYLGQEFNRLIAGDDGEGGVSDVTKESFAAWAGSAAWREPLLFLVESFEHNAPFTSAILKWLFPKLPPKDAAGKAQPPYPEHAARLLAALSVDRQVALSLPQRQAHWEFLWRNQLDWNAEQDRRTWHVADPLLEATEYQSQVLGSLVKVGRGATRLDLSRCTGLTSVAPLASLTVLQWLYLDGCTGLSDLSPLKDLGSLQ